MNTTKNNSPIRPLLAAPMLLALALATLAPMSATLAQAPAPDKAPDAPESKPETPATGAKVNKMDLPFDNMGTNQSDPNAAVVYLIKVRGEVGTDFTATPLRRILEDAKRVKADIIILDIDSAFRPSPDGRPIMLYEAFYRLSNIQGVATELIDRIRDDPSWVKKPRIVSWVKKATGPAAFLPLVTREIYFTPKARMGDCGYLDLMYTDGDADEVVRQKWRGNYLAQAEGLANKGGHDYRVVRAMCREDYVLSYTMVGGKPEFHEDMSGDTILTDDGDPRAGRANTAEEVVRGTGNDVLSLTTDVAKRIGFIDGEAPTLDDLAFLLGVERAYKVYGRRSERILAEWTAQVDKVLPTFEDLQRDLREWRLEGENSEQRNQSRMKRKRIVQKMIDLLLRNSEITLATRSFGSPDGMADRLRQEIVRIDQEIRLDRDDKR